MLDTATSPRARDPGEPLAERPRFMKSRARALKRLANQLADASTPGDVDQLNEIELLRRQARQLMEKSKVKQLDMKRAASRPAGAHHTAPTSGARSDEPMARFAKAMRRTLLELEVPASLADRLVGWRP